MQFRCVIALCSCMFSLYAAALEPEVLRDVEYATVDGHKLLLDLYLPPLEKANDQTQIRSGRAIPVRDCSLFLHVFAVCGCS